MAKEPSMRDPAEELAALKIQVGQVGDSLRRQDDALRTRGMKLPTEAITEFSALIKDISAIESVIGGNVIELGQLRALTATGAMINSTLDVDDVLARAMDQVIVLAGAERGFIILSNEQTGDLEFRISRDSTGKGSTSGDGPQLSMNIVNEVIETGKPMLTDNAYKDPRIQDHMSVAQFVLRSVVCVPLTQRDRRIGAVYVDNRLRAGVFTDRERNLLTAFANQAAVAIENARLFTNIQRSLVEITEMKDLMDNVFASVGSAIITTNANDLVITFNKAAESIFGTRQDDAIGRRLVDVLPLEDADIESHVRTVLENDESFSFQKSMTLPGKTAPAFLSFKFSPLRDSAGDTQGVTVAVDDLTEENEREKMLGLLENYLPPGMMPRIHEIAGIDLGGESREMTCMFAEVRPFNSFPDDIDAQDLMDQINRYLTVATLAVQERDGVIDKYMGSELMVLFNTQLNPQPDHALRAIESALDIRDAFLKFYQEIGILPEPHWYRIGLHTGIATLGNVGSHNRRNFTAIGDTINLSKRLEENATAGQIIISEDLLLKARQIAGTEDLPGLRLEPREALQVKGRQQFTRIYEVFRDQ